MRCPFLGSIGHIISWWIFFRVPISQFYQKSGHLRGSWLYFSMFIKRTDYKKTWRDYPQITKNRWLYRAGFFKRSSCGSCRWQDSTPDYPSKGSAAWSRHCLSSAACDAPLVNPGWQNDPSVAGWSDRCFVENAVCEIYHGSKNELIGGSKLTDSQILTYYNIETLFSFTARKNYLCSYLCLFSKHHCSRAKEW